MSTEGKVSMDKEVVRNAVGGLETLLSRAKRALREAEFEKFGGGDDLGSYESPLDALKYELEGLYSRLLVILEASQLSETRSSLIENWNRLKKLRDGLRHTKQFGDFDHLDSPTLEYFERLISALRMSVSKEMTDEQAWTLNRLKEMLDDTSNLVHGRPSPPRDEGELEAIMHDYLSACFPGFVAKPKIGGSIKSFIPDCGIRTIGTAIEFKFVRTKQEAVNAFSGIVEDIAGYKGSRDWTRFFGVVYQAEPFLSKSHWKSDMERIGAVTWTPILVNGKIGPKRREKTRPRKTAAVVRG
jgi:hypothetical protein